ncbi:hypothetical protein MNBD_ALPHA04-1570 [hydrothermal vent metagenome]|uniref:Uncharacterized protein n=1 Tax=hydrothermal vent metagenome TaxID=652676 RepID=A0A3B0S8N0_9ZZZZ
MDTAETHLGDLLTGGFIMLGAALILVLIFRKFGIGAVLGYLIAGIVAMKRELFESAIYLARQTMYSIDVDSDLIDEADREFRDRDCERLEAQMKGDGDLLAGTRNGFGNEGLESS